MADDASVAERSSSSSVSGSTHTLPTLPTLPTPAEVEPGPGSEQVLIPSFNAASAPSSPTPTGTLSRLGLSLKGPAGPTSPTAAGAAPGSPVERGQVSAITVVALLDQLVNMLGAVQDNQQRMEQRQAELEGAVRCVQGDVTRLSKTHVCTSNSVSKLLERSRKVSTNLKEVKERMDKQALQVKRLEANHSHLLKRNHFKVLIFQEDNEIPSSVLVQDSLKTPLPSQYDAESVRPAPSVAGSVAGSVARDEGLQSIDLSSDEDQSQNMDELFYESGQAASQTYERRADAFKRSSLKKVDSLKKAFSRQSIEKKVNQITTKIVPPEKREKIKKSLTPNHPKSPTAKSSSFKVSPMTFNVKKNRNSDGAAAAAQDELSPAAEAHVEIPPLGGLDAEVPSVELLPGGGEVELVPGGGGAVELVEEALSPPSPESAEAELAINGKAPSVECDINVDQPAGLALPEQDEDVGEEEEDEAGEEEKLQSAAGAAADAPITTVTTAVEQQVS